RPSPLLFPYTTLFRSSRQESALEWRIQNASLPERWSLETFPFPQQSGVNRKQIRAFAELDFVAKKENIVFIGPTGVGKSGLASRSEEHTSELQSPDHL